MQIVLRMRSAHHSDCTVSSAPQNAGLSMYDQQQMQSSTAESAEEEQTKLLARLDEASRAAAAILALERSGATQANDQGAAAGVAF